MVFWIPYNYIGTLRNAICFVFLSRRFKIRYHSISTRGLELQPQTFILGQGRKLSISAKTSSYRHLQNKTFLEGSTSVFTIYYTWKHCNALVDVYMDTTQQVRATQASEETASQCADQLLVITSSNKQYLQLYQLANVGQIIKNRLSSFLCRNSLVREDSRSGSCGRSGYITRFLHQLDSSVSLE